MRLVACLETDFDIYLRFAVNFDKLKLNCLKYEFHLLLICKTYLWIMLCDIA